MSLKIKQFDGDRIRLSLSSPDEKRKKVIMILGSFEGDIKSFWSRANILISSRFEENKGGKTKDGAFLVDSPGEYEIEGVFVQGIESLGEEIIYTIIGDEIKICYLPNLHQKELSSEQLERIGEVDVLIILLNEQDLPSSRETRNIISQIEPQAVVFSGKHSKGKKSRLGDLLKEMEIKSFEKAEELVLKRADLSEDKRRFFILSYKSG